MSSSSADVVKEDVGTALLFTVGVGVRGSEGELIGYEEFVLCLYYEWRC